MTRKWSLAGLLKQARRGHAVVFDGTQFLVIGGAGDVKTESCVLIGYNVTCTEHELGLQDYHYYPELLLVDGDFGNDC